MQHCDQNNNEYSKQYAHQQSQHSRRALSMPDQEASPVIPLSLCSSIEWPMSVAPQHTAPAKS